MSNKASLTNTELEATRRVQMHWPRGLSATVLGAVNSCTAESLTTAIEEMVNRLADGAKAIANKVLQTLKINYELSLEKMITAGNYDWTNGSITPERFPVKGNGIEQVEYKLFHFGCDISSDDADSKIVKEDKENPWQSAGTEHILAFGAQNPEEQREYPIVALNAVGKVDGIRRVLYLYGYDTERFLDLSYRFDDWDACCRFLAVRKLRKSAP